MNNLIIKKISDLTNDNHIVLNDVFIYITPQTLHHIIYDANNRYILNNIDTYVDKRALSISPPDINSTEYIYIEEAYSCLFNEATPPSHNFCAFATSYRYLADHKISNMLVYDTDLKSHISFNNFIVDHLVKTEKIYRCEIGKLYKFKKLIIGIRDWDGNKYSSFSKKLDEIIPITGKKLKYFNLKLQRNSLENWTGTRSFKNDNYILSTLALQGYLPLNMASEFEKQICLRNASYLILNWGGNLDINATSLYNKNQPILALCHLSYKHEYENFGAYKKRNENNIVDGNFFKNPVRFVFDVPDCVTNLDKIIQDFEKDYENFNSIKR